MMTLPTKCPRCGHVTGWSPLRVWCGWCSFTMSAMRGESVEALIARWNAAILDGVGYVELVRENNARDEAKRAASEGFRQRGLEGVSYAD